MPKGVALQSKVLQAVYRLMHEIPDSVVCKCPKKGGGVNIAVIVYNRKRLYKYLPLRRQASAQNIKKLCNALWQ